MNHFSCAILAYLVVLSLALPAKGGDEEAGDSIQKVRVQFQLRSGTTVRGEIRAWDHRVVTGTFGQYAWEELNHRDAWRIGRQFIDRDDYEAWLRFGHALLIVAIEQPPAEARAEQALARAKQLAQASEVSISDRISDVRAEVEAEAMLRKQQAADEARQQLETVHPEARRWPTAPWPELDAAEERDARSVMRSDAERLLGQLGRTIEPIETRHVLLYSDTERYEAVELAKQLDQMAHRFAVIMRRNPTRSLFWGKAVIMVFSEEAAFREIQAEGFGYLARPSDVAIMHPVGPKVFVLSHREGERRRTELELARHFVFGLLHRYESPRRLPFWANEGLAEWMAHEALANSSWLMKDRRKHAYELIRGDAPLPPVFQVDYGDETWQRAQPVVAPLAALLVEYLVEQQPNGFPRWVESIKKGETWEEALKRYYGLTPAQLSERYLRHYRVRD